MYAHEWDEVVDAMPILTSSATQKKKIQPTKPAGISASIHNVSTNKEIYVSMCMSIRYLRFVSCLSSVAIKYYKFLFTKDA